MGQQNVRRHSTVPKSKIFSLSGKHRHDHLHGHAHKGTGGPCQAGDEEVLLPRGVGAPQHSQAHTRTGAQPRHKAGKAQRTFHIQL